MDTTYEKCLMLRDSKTKRYVKQIKLDAELASVNDLQSCFVNIQNLINKIDDKYMALIKSSLVYNFQGLIDSAEGEIINIDDVKYIKRDLQSALHTFIDATIIDLETQYCNPIDIKNGIEVIKYFYHYLNQIQPSVLGGTENQNITIENKISYLSMLYNNYIKNLINSYDFQRNCLCFTIPSNFVHAWQISRAITETDCNIDQLKSLVIDEMDIQYTPKISTRFTTGNKIKIIKKKFLPS
jgi:hypothetical protein